MWSYTHSSIQKFRHENSIKPCNILHCPTTQTRQDSRVWNYIFHQQKKRWIRVFETMSNQQVLWWHFIMGLFFSIFPWIFFPLISFAANFLLYTKSRHILFRYTHSVISALFLCVPSVTCAHRYTSFRFSVKVLLILVIAINLIILIKYKQQIKVA